MGRWEMKPDVLVRGFEACAEQLTDFGYSDVTAEMVAEAHSKWLKGEKPEGVIEMFAFDDFRKYPQIFGKNAA